jgi:tetratricopeptide (TPR) repeat protein
MRRPFRFSFALLLLSACGAPDGKVLEQPEAPLPTDLAAIEKQLLEAPDNPALYAQRARYFEGLDSVAAAERDWRRAIALGGNDPQWRIGLGDLYFRRTRLVDAESLFKEATEAAPKSTEGWTKLSELYLMQSRFKEAMAMANEALRIDPQQARIYDLKGWIHRTAGDTELAISSYQTALERDPKHYDACISLGLLHAGRHDALALQYYDAALSIRPSSVEALYDKAMFAQEHDRDSLALDCWPTITPAISCSSTRTGSRKRVANSIGPSTACLTMRPPTTAGG